MKLHDMKNTILKSILCAAGIILLFIVISYAFVPEVLGGKIVNQSDISGWTGMTNEVVTYNEEHPEDPSFWTNSMFGGMPTISMYGIFKGDWTSWIYDFLLTGARPATYLFISLLGGFLLMLAFGIRPLLAIGGAIAITFCSYNMQIIQVGHNTKMQAIAYMPWVLAAMVYTYRSALAAAGQVLASEKKKKWLMTLLGAVLFAFALSFQIKANHPQISYYLAIVIVVYVLAVFVKILTEKEKKAALAGFFTASALLLVVGGLGICTNLNKLLPTYEYAEYSMRGGSELGKDADSGNDGLELDYATAWSYGIEETPNLLIPDFNGGSSAGDPGLRDSEVRKLLVQARQPDIEGTMKHLPLYWGPQPFTAGPMYMGAISVFLFILGLFVLKGRDKWWLAICTVLAILLAWGSHFMWFTRLWYDLAPLYNKFRTVSMALVILQVTVPLLGFMALDRIWKTETGSRKIRKSALAAYGITGGICLLFALFPSIAGTFAGSSDAGMQDVLAEALRADRKAMLVKDAVRSFIFITLAFGVICWNLRSSVKGQDRRSFAAASVVLAALVLADLWGVDKRYLNSSHFVSRRDFSSQFEARPVDKIILEDKSPDYRVLDLSGNTFNDSHTSYWHKSIGGYSPAKIQRYQDLIEHHLTGEINSIIRTVNSSATIQDVEAGLPDIPVLSMLNDKYIILGAEYPPVENSQAFGNCWITRSAAPAATPDEEIALLSGTDLRNTAVIGDDFAWARERLDSLSRLAVNDMAPADSVWMTGYEPNELRYQSRLQSERAVIFSEIYYPKGWKLTIDGEPAELFRADWILRGAFIPAGEHEIVMRFEPQVYKTGAALSRASSITLYILLLLSGAGIVALHRKRKQL